ncbi:MAG: hypothetical protein ACRENE_07345, partial [Polyangiaceae bacterium]
ILLGACAGGASRDVAGPSNEVVSAPAPSAGGGGSAGYDYVARRHDVVVALAEARGVDPAIAKAAVDRIADSMDECVSDPARRGAAPDGAARVVAQIDPTGAVANAAIRVDAKTAASGATATAVLCFLAPTRLLQFPLASANGGERGIALEALWGAAVR